MSEDRSADTTPSCCAFCGIAEVNDIELKECDDCDLVKYCSRSCQKDHKSQHEEACKKRAPELRDELLYTQPASTNLGDCPICMLPLPIDVKKTALTSCCSKDICKGCVYACVMREKDASLKPSCPFCRNALTETNDEEEVDKLEMKRIEANDPNAIHQKGMIQYKRGNYRIAFEWLTKAAELGYAEAHYQLSGLYHYGRGVKKDEGKQIHHLEKAAIGGQPEARYNLGYLEWRNDNKERAVKHWIIAAKQGDDDSTKRLMVAFKEGLVSKEALASTLRAHHAAIDAMKSPQREAAERYDKMGWII